MKIILVIASLVALAVAGPSFMDEWSSFKIQHGKTYRTINEEQKRHAIFMENLKMIEEHNAKYEAGLASYRMKVNMFSDLLPEEVSAMLNGYKKSEKGGSLRTVFQPDDNTYVPESIDWRQKGAVTAVKNQGRCGGCWAFSTTGTMEGQLFKKTGRLVSLSEQQLIDCSGDYGNEGCSGGLMDNAFKYLMSSGGLASEASYPFEGRNEYCGYTNSDAVSGTAVRNFVDVPQEDEDALKKAVGTVGPVSIAVSAGNTGFLHYGGGIFSGDTCESSQLDHGILVVGYGSEDGQDYWIVKNSWGPNWGEEGFMRLARNQDNACGIASDASYPQL